jgi:hypothetical protein
MRAAGIMVSIVSCWMCSCVEQTMGDTAGETFAIWRDNLFLSPRCLYPARSFAWKLLGRPLV